MLSSEDLALVSEYMGRRQLGLGVEAGEVVRGCGSKRSSEGLGGPQGGLAALKGVCGGWGDVEGRGEGRWSPPGSSSRGSEKKTG